MFKIFKCFKRKEANPSDEHEQMRVIPLTETRYYNRLVSATRNTLIDATDKQVFDIVNLALTGNLNTDNKIVNQYGLTKSFIDAYLDLTKMNIENVRLAEKSIESFNQELESLLDLIKSDFKTVYDRELNATVDDMVLTIMESDNHLGKKTGISCKEAYYEIWTRADLKPVKTLMHDSKEISRRLYRLHEHYSNFV